VKVSTKRIISAEATANRRCEAETAPAAKGPTDGSAAAAAPGHRHGRHHRDSEIQRRTKSKFEQVERADSPTESKAARDQNRERLLTPKDAADVLRLSTSWLAKARMSGDGPPFVKIGRSIRYSEIALAQWTKSRVRLSTSER
jgi:predicted DNA-binding transcriptional regulator AlpA